MNSTIFSRFLRALHRWKLKQKYGKWFDFPYHCTNSNPHCVLRAIKVLKEDEFFLWSAPVAFRRVALETPEWTSRDSNHHRQSVSAGKTNAIPTEPLGRLSTQRRRKVYRCRVSSSPIKRAKHENVQIQCQPSRLSSPSR